MEASWEPTDQASHAKVNRCTSGVTDSRLQTQMSRAISAIKSAGQIWSRVYQDLPGNEESNRIPRAFVFYSWKSSCIPQWSLMCGMSWRRRASIAITPLPHPATFSFCKYKPVGFNAPLSTRNLLLLTRTCPHDVFTRPSCPPRH